MVGFISFLVVFAILLTALRLVVVTLVGAADAIEAAIRGEAQPPVVPVQTRSRRMREAVITRPAFAPLRAAA